MRDYTTAIKEICDLLAACGSSISNVEHIATILNGLPIEYEPSVATITASKETYTVENVVSILVDAETRLEDSSGYSIGINYTKYAGKTGEKGGQETDAVTSHDEGRYKEAIVSKYKGRPRQQCQLCGKLGHLVDRCWHRFDQNFKGIGACQSKPSAQVQVNTCSCCNHTTEAFYNQFVSSSKAGMDALVADDEREVHINALMVDGHVNFAKWFPDSGATHHVASSSSLLQDKNVYAGKGKVHLGDGSALNIEQIGRTFIDSSTRTLCLDQLLYVPSISKNLMSVAKFAKDNDVFFEFHKTTCYIKDASTRIVLLEGQLDEGLYNFQPTRTETTMKVHHTTLKDDYGYLLWHQRLGHPSPDVIKMALHKAVLPKDNSVYLYSRNTWIYLLKNKSDVSAVFEAFMTFVQNQFKVSVQALQTDEGAEFKFLEQIAFKMVSINVIFDEKSFPFAQTTNISHKNNSATLFQSAFVPIVHDDNPVADQDPVAAQGSNSPLAQSVGQGSSDVRSQGHVNEQLAESDSPAYASSPNMVFTPTSNHADLEATPVHSEHETVASLEDNVAEEFPLLTQHAQPIQEVVQNVATESRKKANSTANTHAMITRRKNGIVKPKLYNLQVAKQLPSSHVWKEQMCAHKGPQVGREEQCLQRQTWELVVEVRDEQPTPKWLTGTVNNAGGSHNRTYHLG
ncbi:hypothetical protein GQ457_14G022270 [Hibiscus cannabinus]